MTARGPSTSRRGSRSGPPLSPRLEAMASFALPDRPVIDVGADHAYVAIALARTGRHPRVIATDTSAGALDRARAHARQFGVADVVELRESWGLDEMADVGGTVLIGGMGGHRVLEILGAGAGRSRPPTGTGTPGRPVRPGGQADPLVGVDRLVLQPQTARERVRRELAALDWVILDEVVCEEEGQFYWVMAAEPALSPRVAGNPDVIPPGSYDDLDWAFGAYPRRREDANLHAFLAFEDRRLVACLADMRAREPGAGPEEAEASIASAARARKRQLEERHHRIREERRRLQGPTG